MFRASNFFEPIGSAAKQIRCMAGSVVLITNTKIMNIYISNLDQTVTKEALTDLFKQHGDVKTAEVVLDVFTGQPRGFAYVEMPVDADAENAINELNNYELNDRAISVQAAKPKVEHKGSYPVGNGFQKGMPFQRSFGNQKRKGARKR